MKNFMCSTNKLFATLALVALSASPALAQDQGNMFHTIRAADGTWLLFGDVKAQAGDIGVMTDGSISGNQATRELHVVGVTADGRMWHTIRAADGTWLPFGDVTTQAGNPGSFCYVGTALIGGSLQVVGATLDGNLWHTIRAADGTWLPFGDVKAQAGNPGPFCSAGHFADVSVAGNPATGELHVLGVTADGRMWHTIRAADGTWLPFGDVRAATGFDPGPPFLSLGTTMIGGNLHVVGTVAPAAHTLWHTIRAADGTWLPFVDVEAQAGDRCCDYDVSVAGNPATGELHLIGSPFGGGLWHTIRATDGTWLPFGDVTTQAGNPGPLCGAPVAIDLIGPDLHVAIITTVCIF